MKLRQGDVMGRLVKLPEVEKVALGKVFVLADGEQTGHAHTIEGRDIEAFQDAEGNRFFTVLAESWALLTHQEHYTIAFPKTAEGYGYEVVRQVEYAPEAIRNVSD